MPKFKFLQIKIIEEMIYEVYILTEDEIKRFKECRYKCLCWIATLLT